MTGYPFTLEINNTWPALHILSKELELRCTLCITISKKVMDDDREKLENIYQKLNEKDDTVLKKWYQSLIPKAILLFPVVAFVFTFLKVNTDKSILDLLSFVAVGGLLVFGGIFLNYLLSKGR